MKLSALQKEDYLAQFKEFLSTSCATEKRGIVYIWKLERSVKRVIGASQIIYIGKTIRTFSARYSNSKSLRIELDYFERYYRHMIELYGPISIEIIQTENPSVTEWEKLMEYNHLHKEYPPLNRSIPQKPSLD